MRLFLSSYRAGNYPDRLVELFGKGSEVAVITNAKDYKTIGERKIKVKEVLDFFTDLGLKSYEIDLRKYFDNKGNIKKDLRKFTGFWFAGGSTFLLRRALRQSELEPILGDLVRKNEVVLGGESAGALIVGPTLKGPWTEDDDEDNPYLVKEGYDKEVIWEGLDYLNYVPVPHYNSPDYGDFMDGYIKYLEQNNLPYRTITEEQAIIINGDKEEFLR